MRNSALLAAKTIFLAVCLFVAFGGHYPPAYAQKAERYQIRAVPVLTVEDAIQDDQLAAINKHLEATDANVAQQAAAISKNALDISGMQGEERIIGAVLALLSTSGIVLQLRRKAA